MRTPLGFTVVIALDSRTLGQFRLTWPTWRRNKPDLLDMNWLVIADGFSGSPEWWRRQLEPLELPYHQLVLWSWPQSDDGDLPVTQRERMLTAFVKVPPACCHTSHWIKIDTDVVAVRSGQWIDRSWFDGAAIPALIASAWRYTKPPGALHTMQDWADHHPDSLLRETAPLTLPEPDPEKQLIVYPRIASWICIVELGFSKVAAQLCPGRLPIPSQDTYHWYLAERLKIPICRHNFKRGGWETIHSDRRRARRVQEVLKMEGDANV